MLLAPRPDDRLDSLVVHSLEDWAAHDTVRADAALIASGEFWGLALQLTLFLGHVGRILAEDLARRHLVQVMPLAAIIGLEGLNLPILTGQPRQHATLNVRQVGDDELLALWRDQGAAHGHAAALADIVPDEVVRVGLEGAHGDVLHLLVEPVGRAWQVLRLEYPPRVTRRACSARELDRAAQAAVRRGGVDQGLVLRWAGRRGLLAHLKQLTHLRIQITAQRGLKRALGQVVEVEARPAQILNHAPALRGALHRAVGQSFDTSGQSSESSVESSESRFREFNVDGDTTVVNVLVVSP